MARVVFLVQTFLTTGRCKKGLKRHKNVNKGQCGLHYGLQGTFLSVLENFSFFAKMLCALLWRGNEKKIRDAGRSKETLWFSFLLCQIFSKFSQNGRKWRDFVRFWTFWGHDIHSLFISFCNQKCRNLPEKVKKMSFHSVLSSFPK